MPYVHVILPELELAISSLFRLGEKAGGERGSCIFLAILVLLINCLVYFCASGDVEAEIATASLRARVCSSSSLHLCVLMFSLLVSLVFL
jgi:hypothetical protein